MRILSLELPEVLYLKLSLLLFFFFEISLHPLSLLESPKFTSFLFCSFLSLFPPFTKHFSIFPSSSPNTHTTIHLNYFFHFPVSIISSTVPFFLFFNIILLSFYRLLSVSSFFLFSFFFDLLLLFFVVVHVPNRQYKIYINKYHNIYKTKIQK